jgi:dolichol-phosphate mannosyltransferase
VLALDLAPVPDPHFASDYWGLPSGTHAGALGRLPIDALFVLLGKIGAVGLGEKALLLAIVFLAGFGMHRTVPARSEAGRYFAGVLYALNPFVYDRLYAGQWFLLLGYALIPHAFASFTLLLKDRWRSAWRFGLIAGAVGAASAHMFFLLMLLCAAATISMLVRGSGRITRLGRATLGLLLAVLPSLYWLAPTPGLVDFWRHVGPAQLELYSAVPDPSWGLGLTLAGLHGFWNVGGQAITSHSALPALTASLLALTFWGLTRRRPDPLAWAVAVTGLLGFVLALGTAGPTGGAFRFFVEHVAPARSFREPQKGIALLVFAYAYLGAAAVDDVRAHVRAYARPVGLALCALVLAVPVAVGHRQLGGLWGAMSTSHYPDSWGAANALLKRQGSGSRTLVLPWHGYLALAFAHHRVVANPSAAYFAVPILASRSIGDPAASDNSDPLDRYVDNLLARSMQLRDLGACLAPLGVSHILLMQEADHARYSFLARQRDLVVERRWHDLVLYRNTVPASIVMAATGAHVGTTCSARAKGLVPLTATSSDPAHIRIDAPPRGDVVLTSAFRSDWSLAGRGSSPFLGVVNAFPSARAGTTIELGAYRQHRRNYLLGLLGMVALLGSTLTTRRARERTQRLADALDTRALSLWVVLPTYNEADNLAPLVSALERVFERYGLDGRILVVDDGSPDGTGDIADRIAHQNPRVQVLHRRAKNGLGRAYVDGFRVVLDAGAALVVQMDCDFSHDPEDVARLVEETTRADIVLGSRYVAGGRTEDWGVVRRFVSRFGSMYARAVLGAPVRDLTGGFKCFRREALLALDIESVDAAGYGFQIEMTHRALKRGLAIREIPILFRDRRAGQSKMSSRIVLEAMLLVPRLRLRGPRGPVRSTCTEQPVIVRSDRPSTERAIEVEGVLGENPIHVHPAVTIVEAFAGGQKSER